MFSRWIVFSIVFVAASAHAEWKVDFSRRQQNLVDMETKKQIYKKEKKTFLDMVLDREAPIQDLVILHKDKQFYPANVQVKTNRRYRVHVVNVDKENKNVSFMLDAYSQHHGTFFGEDKSFVIETRKEGMFQFQCPETAAKGHLVVRSSDTPIDSPLQNIEMRQPASE